MQDYFGAWGMVLPWAVAAVFLAVIWRGARYALDRAVGLTLSVAALVWVVINVGVVP